MKRLFTWWQIGVTGGGIGYFIADVINPSNEFDPTFLIANMLLVGAISTFFAWITDPEKQTANDPVKSEDTK